MRLTRISSGNRTLPALTHDVVEHLTKSAAATTTPVLLVHGLGGSTSGWIALVGALSALGLTVATVSYQPFGSSIERLAQRLADKVSDLLAATCADKVHLVGHSLGGVLIAQALADGLLADQVDTIITIATPFGGSPWAQLIPFAAIVRALRSGSPVLRRLALATVPEGVQWLAITAGSDRIVPGHRSVPAQATVRTLSVYGVGHMRVRVQPRVVNTIVRALPLHTRAVA